jgi:hypothetical protein
MGSVIAWPLLSFGTEKNCAAYTFGMVCAQQVSSPRKLDKNQRLIRVAGFCFQWFTPAFDFVSLAIELGSDE